MFSPVYMYIILKCICLALCSAILSLVLAVCLFVSIFLKTVLGPLCKYTKVKSLVCVQYTYLAREADVPIQLKALLCIGTASQSC